ncbi:sphingolipid long chain base-responsive protein pil1 [Gigaspora margarita]|uniref:Sphingolipid long chain base-responsive protein pil1 n=2 Tax=Gigaspora margarita TaxID=4874 RepID=A0A8H4AQB6_GIGMA|nr:sphingolipid long chain base-responsive protein pil1 [Gigaspora margarita]
MSNLHVPNSSGERQPSMFDSIKTLNLDNIHHDIRRNFAQVDPRLPKEIKNIALLVTEQKNLLTSLQNVSTERKEASRLLNVWGKEAGDDISDITEKLGDLFSKISDVETVMIEKNGHYRKILKKIREAEEKLIPFRERRRKIQDEIQKIQKSHPKSPRIPELEADLVFVNRDALKDEIEAGNAIRKHLKEALTIHLDSMFECSEKIAIISGFGMNIVNLIDVTPCKVDEKRPEYKERENTHQIVKDCQVSLLRWQPSSQDIQALLPALTNTAPAALAAQKEEYEHKLQQLTSSMNTLKEEHDKQISEFSVNIENQKREYETQINEFVSALAAQKEGYEAQLNDLSTALATERQTVEQKIRESNASLETQKEQYEAKIKDQLQSSEAKINELTAALDAQRKQHDEQLKQYNTLLSTKQEYEIALKERDSIISKLQSDISSVATERGKLSQVVKDLEETIKSKSTTVEQKEDKVGLLESEISSIKNQLANLSVSAPVTTTLSDPSNRPSSNNTSTSTDETSSEPLIGPHLPPFQAGGQQPPPSGGYMYQYGNYSQPQYYQGQQQYYNQGQTPYGYQQQPIYGQQGPPSGYQQPYGQSQGPFVGGFMIPDDAPPAYDGPKDGYNDDKKEKS